jgi:hypothetical protein
MTEHWKPIPSKPGLMASSLGRVKLPDSVAPLPNGGIRSYKPKPTYGVKTKASKTAQHKYMVLTNRKLGNLKIHRLVCEAFHGPAPLERAVVLHLDENSLNNKPENLRWGTQKENLNMPKFIAYCKSRTGENSPTVKGKNRKFKDDHAVRRHQQQSQAAQNA